MPRRPSSRRCSPSGSTRSSGCRDCGSPASCSASPGSSRSSGFEPTGGEHAVAGSLAVVAAALCYSLAALYAGRRFRGFPPLLLSFGALAWATLFVLPAGAAQMSDFGWETLASVVGLGVGATAVAYLLYFGLIAGAGASRAILVTYLVPSLALVYGAVFLDEQVTALALVGLALVLSGVALGTRRSRAAPEVASSA